VSALAATEGEALEQRVLQPGERLVEAGERGDDAFWVERGLMDVRDETGASVGVLGPGSLVGEYAALTGGERSATVVAAEPSTVSVVPAAALERLLRDDPDLAASVREEAVRRIRRTRALDALRHAFSPASADAVAEVAQLADLRHVPAGAAVPDDLLVVVSGRLRRHAPAGETVAVAHLGPGSVLGEHALLGSPADGASLMAVRDSVVAALPPQPLLELVAQRPQELVVPVMKVAAGLGTTRREVDRTIVVAVTSADAHPALVGDLARAVGTLGATQALDSAWVDTQLARPGIAQAEPGDPREVRLVELQAHLERDRCYLVLQPDREDTAWSRRVLREGDVLALVTSPDPDEAERAQVARVLAAAGPATLRVLVQLHPATQQRPTGTAALVAGWGVDHVLHARQGSSCDVQRVARVLAGRPVALVLGGGGAKGMASLGVYQAMAQLGIPLDIVGGTSMGSAFAAGMAQGLTPDEATEAAARLMSNVLDYTIPVVSLLKGERASEAIAAQFGGWDIEDMWLPFFCVSTNLTRGRQMVHRAGDVVTAVRASVAIPGAFPPVPVDGDLLVDGGVTNNLPVDVMRRLHPSAEVIAVEGAPAMGPRAKADYGLSVSGWQALRASVGHQRTYPGVMAVLMRSMITGSMHQRDAVVQGGAVDLLLDMDLRGVGLMDFHRARDVARIGYEQAMPRLEGWLEGRGPFAGPDAAPLDA
jgi:predicted acylesterase/phospholipase RssA/CRP-like cAMP-binding protein